MKRSFYTAILVAMYISLTGASGCIRPVLGIEGQCNSPFGEVGLFNQNPRYRVTIKVMHQLEDGRKIEDENVIVLNPQSMVTLSAVRGDYYEFRVFNALGNADGGNNIIIPFGCPNAQGDDGRWYDAVVVTKA